MKKTKVGTVVSGKMQKTVGVLVVRRFKDRRFHKYVSKRKKYLVHDEKQECQPGDVVRIEETRPLSKRKSWRLAAILKKGFGLAL